MLPPGPLGPVRVLQYFSTNVALTARGTPVYVTFKPNEIVAYDPLVRRLLELGCPVVPVEDVETTFCPKCRSLASWKTNKKAVTISLANASVTLDHQFFSFRLGDIVSHPWLVEALRKTGVPLGHADAVECPNCKFVWLSGSNE